MAKTESAGRAVTYVDGSWHEGGPLVVSPRDHGVWMASTVFDGARAIRGHTPDLEQHCRRAIRSAEIMGLASPLAAD